MFVLVAANVLAAVQAARFEDSPLFVKRVDPYSDVVSYILKPKAYAFSQQSIYFTNKSVTDDGRFLLFKAWDSPTAKTNRLVAVDIEKGTFKEIPAGKRNAPIPFLDTAKSLVYWFDEEGLHRYDLRAGKDEAEIVCPYPENLAKEGPMRGYCTHLTLSADRKKAFLDMRCRKEDRWIQGLLLIDEGCFEKWTETDYELAHGQINPVDDRIAICARQPYWNGVDGKEHRVHKSPCVRDCPRLQLVEPGKVTWIPPQNGQHATHENWADDGKGFYWCANGDVGVYYHDLATGRQECICPRNAVHASMDPSNRYVVFDNSFGRRYRGCAWQVGFYNRETGACVYPFTRMEPLVPSNKPSMQHPDPHPQFVMGGKYIVCTLNNADGHMDTAVVPVDQLVRKTAAAFAPERALGQWSAGTDPATVSRRLSEQFLTTTPWAYKPEGCDTARKSYGGGVMMYCVASLWAHGLDCAALSGQKDIEKRLLDSFWPLMGAEKHRIPQPGHVDNTIFGALPLEVAYLTDNDEARKLGLSFADAQWGAPGEHTMKSKQNLPFDEQQKLFKDGYTPETRFWIDDMYMITFLQVQAYRATGDIKYLNRAAKELALYIRKLQRPDGLFDHAPGVPFVWGRGDGWVAGGLSLVMTHLPVTNPDYPTVQEGYLKMMNALLRTQRADGLWGQLVDDPASWTETSGSAMFTFGFVTGVKRGVLDADRFGPAARKAYLALVGKLDAHANLADVCEGTVKKNDRQHYLDRPRVNGAPYGQAALMWICNALLAGEPVKTPATSKLFEKFTDPQSGVVSYLLKPGIESFQQQSLYYSVKSMTDDGRFLVFDVYDGEHECDDPNPGKSKHFALVDFAYDRILRLPKTGGEKHQIPFLDVKTDTLYYICRDDYTFRKRELAKDPQKEIIMCPLPKELLDLGYVRGWFTHLTMSADRTKAFLETRITEGMKGPTPPHLKGKLKSLYIQGTLDMTNGKWHQWTDTPFANHAAINPADDTLAYYGWGNYLADYSKRRREAKKRGEQFNEPFLSMFFAHPDGTKVNFAPEAIPHATHQTWSEDGKTLYWCSRDAANEKWGVYAIDPKTMKQRCIAPVRACHAMLTREMDAITFDWPHVPLGRGCGWETAFYNCATKKQVFIHTDRPPIADIPNKKYSNIHPDPHPQFVMDGRYVVSSFNCDAPRRMTVSVTPTAQLWAKTK